MGCSSGSLKAAGEYEASGPVLAYLMAGWAEQDSVISILNVVSMLTVINWQ